jgi:hypothetical protein
VESAFLSQSIDVNPSGVKTDGDSPLSFSEWKQKRPGLSEASAFSYYNQYLLGWFGTNKKNILSTKFVLRQKYLYLLNQLQLFFSAEEKNEWYNKIDLADERELLLAIPYFAKKLKNISLYYLKLRKKIQGAKVKYNAVGTPISIKHEIYNFLLETCSSINKELPVSLQQTLPTFSDLQESLVIDIEEMYDDQQYFDRSPNVPISNYFNLADKATESYFQTKGIVLSSSEDLLNSFSISTSADLESLQTILSSTIFELTDVDLYATFIQNYLAENKYTISVTAPTAIVDITDVPMNVGNNFFYYPYGTVDTSLSIKGRITPVPLSSLNIEGATAGSTIDTSDTIFVKNGNDVKAAWYRYEEFTPEDKTIKTIFRSNETTSFLFPYPGYGLSSASVPWTGSSFETTKSFDFLPKEVKTAIYNQYWNQELPTDTTDLIWLNDTSLISDGANPGVSPEYSDNFYKRINLNDTLTPRGELSGAWLYRFTSTAIPISPVQTNVVMWPYNIVDPNEPVPDHVKLYPFNNSCESISVNKLNNSHFTASSAIEFADKIYKLENVADEIEAATECCWLSSQTMVVDGNKFIEQDGASLLLESGKATIFAWMGPAMEIEDAFQTLDHQKDCPFVTNVPVVSSMEWQKCSCKQVYFSPFGHPGETFNEYGSHCDYICELPSKYSDTFDLGSWLDEDGSVKEISNKFAWYKTEDVKQTWGKGVWVKFNGEKSFLLLSPGKLYCYYRANNKTDSVKFPSLTVLKKFYENKTKWIQAKKNENNEWVSNNTESQMILSPGDVVKFDKRQVITWHPLSSTFIEVQSENRGSEWSSIDYIVLDSDLQTASISWPFDSIGTEQSPPVNYASLSAIIWWKIESLENSSEFFDIYSTYRDSQQQLLALPDSNTLPITSIEAEVTTNRVYINANNFSFTPNVTGLYAISVSAVDVFGNHHFLDSTTIPLLTVVPLYKEQTTEVSRNFPCAGFLLEQKLMGWDYSNGLEGAKPYWAKLYNEKEIATKQKGVYSWGYPNQYIDEYIPHNIPEISPLQLNYGDVVEYERREGTLYWNQPVRYNTFTDKKEWKKLETIQTTNSNLSSIFETQTYNTVEAMPTGSATDILLTNNANGLPIEIYYYALNSFVWPVSVVVTDASDEERITSPELYLQASQPSINLTNRFYPTIAVLPTLDEVYTKESMGGYFLPNSLGASQFVNKDFNVSFKTTNLSGDFIIEDNSVHLGGRGRTKRDQPTLYTWEEQNQWLKESPVAEKLAGAVSKQLTKSLQTFVPYQTNLAETALGLVTPNSRVSPWGGAKADEWTDNLNEPKGFTGIRNVPAWAETQVLKQNKKWIDCWTSDIFGNQYGLFKQLDGVSVGDRRNVGGELWTRTNDQIVLPGKTSLSTTFDLFKSSPSFYSELTGSGIKSIDCFFNMLMLETSLSTIFVQVDYDYEQTKIVTVFDNIIKEPNTSQRYFDQTWFFPENKKIVALFTNLSGTSFYPELMELDLNTRTYKKVFPNYLFSNTKLVSPNEGIGNIHIKEVDRGCLSYNNLQKSFLITYKGVDQNDKLFVIDYIIEQEKDLIVKNLVVYIDKSNELLIEEPPFVSDSFFDTFVVPLSTFGTIEILAGNQPTSFNVLTVANNVTATNNGHFNYYFENAGLYQVNYQVSNAIGTSQYCLTLSAI